MLGSDQQYKVKMLADFYPDFHLTEISDPLHDRDAKSYEKSYWLVYKSVRWEILQKEIFDEYSRYFQGTGEVVKGGDETSNS